MKLTVVPFRNAIMLSIAAGFAESTGAEALVIAAHSGDHAIYPDCREEFMRAMGDAMRHRHLRGRATAATVHRAEQGPDRRARRPPRRGLCAHLVLLQRRRPALRPVRYLRRTREAFLAAGLPDPTVYESTERCPRNPAGQPSPIRFQDEPNLTTTVPGRGAPRVRPWASASDAPTDSGSV